MSTGGPMYVEDPIISEGEHGPFNGWGSLAEVYGTDFYKERICARQTEAAKWGLNPDLWKQMSTNIFCGQDIVDNSGGVEALPGDLSEGSEFVAGSGADVI
eukprot:TRINITY_DN94717_c0_g1_i1.p2 TRINITY_DN94717_c0_g1~~TRINITY_DN94717_c0_g1_i1.p2  ORF type:complete len:112 (+),score=19.93 TRINITY_DN94717_c0_g1_i1:34-336(+)